MFIFIFLEFDEYMNTLTPEDNERNHWFRDYWEDLFECDIDHRSGPGSGSNEIRKRRQDEDDPAGGDDIEKPRSRQRRRKLCNPQLRLVSLNTSSI